MRSIARICTILIAISIEAQDEVADPAERKAFEEILRTVDPLARRSMATVFLKRFPDSSLLAQVYEAAAKSSMALSDDASALVYARQSLKLYPENPLLLLPLAALHAKRGNFQEATERARAALQHLDRFALPGGKGVREELRGQAIRLLNVERKEDARSIGVRQSYAGSDACKSCHTDKYIAWQQTGMARMLRTVTPLAVAGDFDRNTEYRDAAGAVSAKMFRNKNSFFMDLRRTSGNWDRYRVDYTIGSKWQQAYATRMPSGELHVLPVQYNQLQKAWINYWSTIDPAGSERAQTGEFHRAREVTSYQQNCAPCHTSQVRGSGFAEPGVNCEMCHGPAASHAEGKASPWSFRRADHKSYVEVCAQCHAQSAIRVPSKPFPPRYERRPYVEFSRKAFYRDGRFRETTFIVEAFERSACFRKGQAHCGHCHDPHPPDAAGNPKSLKFLNDPDQMCLQCHDKSLAAEKHTKHAATTEGSRCASCHMPKIMNSLSFLARTHQIDDVPDAAMTSRFGSAESPNACLLCHQDRSVAWLNEQSRAW